MEENGKTLRVVAVGELCASDVCGEGCETCPKNRPGTAMTLLEGVSNESVMYLFDEVEIVPAGTIEELKKLRNMIQV